MERPTTPQIDYATAIIAHHIASYGTGGSESSRTRLAFAVFAAMGGVGKVPEEFSHIEAPPKHVANEKFEPPVELAESEDDIEDDDPEFDADAWRREAHHMTKARIAEAYPDIDFGNMTKDEMVQEIVDHHTLE